MWIGGVPLDLRLETSQIRSLEPLFCTSRPGLSAGTRTLELASTIGTLSSNTRTCIRLPELSAGTLELGFSCCPYFFLLDLLFRTVELYWPEIHSNSGPFDRSRVGFRMFTKSNF